MTKKEFIKSKVHRILDELENFDTSNRILTMKVDLENAEEILGVYQNHPGTEFESIVITTLGIHILGENSVSSVRYSDIETIRSPQTKDEDRLLIMLKNGEVKTLSILGRSGQFRDIFSFLRFLDRVVKPTPSA